MLASNGKERLIWPCSLLCVHERAECGYVGAAWRSSKIKLAEAWAEGLSGQRQHRSGANYIFGIGFILAHFDVGNSCHCIM